VKSFKEIECVDEIANCKIKETIGKIYNRLSPANMKGVCNDENIKNNLQLTKELKPSNFMTGVRNNIKLWDAFCKRIQILNLGDKLPLIKYKKVETKEAIIILHDIVGKNEDKIYALFSKIIKKEGIDLKSVAEVILVVHGNDFDPPIKPGFLKSEEIEKIRKKLNVDKKNKLIVFSMTHDDFDPINELFKSEPDKEKKIAEYINSKLDEIFFKEKIFAVKEYELALIRLGLEKEELWAQIAKSFNEIEDNFIPKKFLGEYNEIKSAVENIRFKQGKTEG